MSLLEKKVSEQKDHKTIWTGERLVGIAVVFFVLNLVGSLVVYNQLQESKDVQYQTRAVACRTQLAFSLPLKENCLHPKVLNYFDPDEDITAVIEEALGG